MVIYSYDATFHTYQDSEKALSDVFPLKNYEIDIEFLDSKRYPEKQLYQNVYEGIKIKQKNQSHYDIIIACNDNALDFCLENQADLFFQTPIIFWGINDLDKAFLQDQNEWVTGIAENISLDKTLDLIRKLHPTKNKLQVITDNTNTGKSDFKVFLQTIKKFPSFTYEVIRSNEYSLKEYTRRLQQIDKNDLILLFSSYHISNGYLRFEEINELLEKNTKSIIYVIGEKGIGNGYMGGIKVNYYDYMYSSCLIAKQILTGTSVKHLKVILYPTAENIIDYKQLSKHHIDLDNIPKEVTIINLPDNHIEVTRSDFFKILIFILLLFIFLSLVIYLTNAKLKSEKSHRIFAENYLNMFNENHSIMILIEADSQRITDANRTAAKFYGYSQKKIKSLHFKDLCKLPQLDIDAVLIQSLKQSSHFEQKHLTQSGEVKDVEIHSGKIVIGKTSYIFAIIHDISKRVETEHKLLQAKRKAEESDRLKSAFLANMSHEIRTPMNSILGFSSMLADEDINDDMWREFIKHIQNSGEHLLNLINDIVDLSKIEANQLKIVLSNCELNQLLEDIYLLFKDQIGNSNKKHLNLLLNIGINKPNFIIKTDAVRLKQILLNLLSNALKFTDNGTIEFGYKYREDSVIQFFVKDTGIGISPNMQKQIFLAFQQIEEYASRNQGGTGLGLSITRSLVEKLGGHIWVMSERGEGSRFYFTHPGENNRLNL